MFSFEGDKPLGPDGFSMVFFQKKWNIVGKDVCDAIKELFGARCLLKELNSTFLSLIPKKVGANTPDAFCPISLCKSIYKIISKVLTLRTLSILSDIISLEQSGFILGRQIRDLIIIVHENIHSMVASHNQGLLMKLDLSKAYDHVDWNFLFKILKSFGFGNRCIQLISQLVLMTSLAILVKNSSSSFFSPSRGLRQGDPISTILFIIMAECLGRYINHLNDQGSIHGLCPSSFSNASSHE